MTYSIIGILASLVMLIINRNLLLVHGKGGLTSTQRCHRDFLLVVLCYYVTDALWGILDEHRLTALEFADTSVYFVSMAAAVLLWTRYVVSYLEDRSGFGKVLKQAGWLFLCFEVVVVALNHFFPILFWFDESGAYHAGAARYVTLAIQILLFLMTFSLLGSTRI